MPPRSYFSTSQVSSSAQQQQPQYLLSLFHSGSLESLLARIQPAADLQRLRSELFEGMKRHLMEVPDVRDVVLGGSVAKATDLAQSDLDIVVLTDNLESIHNANLYEAKFAALEKYLEEEFGVGTEWRHLYDGPEIDLLVDVKNSGTYLHGILRNIPFDILIGYDLGAFEDIANALEGDPHCRSRFGGSFVRKHVQFFERPGINKNGIRLAKWWAVHVAEPNIQCGRIRPFLLEILAAHFVQSRPGGAFDGFKDTFECFKGVLWLLIEWQDLRIVWSHVGWERFHPQPRRLPLVLDPCNPTNNVARTLKTADWRCLGRVAQDTLRELDSA